MVDEPPRREPPPMVPLRFTSLSDEEMKGRAASLLEAMRTRRSVRTFSPDPIDLDVVRRCIETAAQAPSGAHKQPWTFVLVRDPTARQRIREAAEEEERAFYAGRAGQRWLDDLDLFGTGPDKPFIEEAPALVAVFAHKQGRDGDKTYYVQESVGIAVGFFLAAIHLAGLCALTHTPSPMRFLERILERPAHERAYLLIPVGRPSAECVVPAIERKALEDVLVEV